MTSYITTFLIKTLLIVYLGLAIGPYFLYSLTDHAYRGDNLPSVVITKPHDGEVYDAVVRLNDKNSHFFCSAFVISNMYAITAAHCVVEGMLDSPRTTIMVKDSNGRVITTAKTAAFNQRLDTAIVMGDFARFKKLNVLTDYSALRKIEQFGKVNKSCGYPMNSSNLFCTNVEIDNYDNFHLASTAAGLLPGMSGGPLIDIDTNTAYGINSYVNGPESAFASMVSIFETFNLTVVRE